MKILGILTAIICFLFYKIWSIADRIGKLSSDHSFVEEMGILNFESAQKYVNSSSRPVVQLVISGKVEDSYRMEEWRSSFIDKWKKDLFSNTECDAKCTSENEVKVEQMNRLLSFNDVFLLKDNKENLIFVKLSEGFRLVKSNSYNLEVLFKGLFSKDYLFLKITGFLIIILFFIYQSFPMNIIMNQTSPLSVIGNLHYNNLLKMWVIEDADTVILSERAHSVLGNLTDEIYFDYFTILVLIVLLLAFVVLVKNRMRRLLKEPSNTAEDPTMLYIENYDCIKCNNRTRAIMYLPCNHSVYCKECSASTDTTNCPKCGVSVQEHRTVYFC